MPGELEDEYAGPFVGRYERKYKLSPDWESEVSYGNLPGRPELSPTGEKVHKTMMNMVKKHIDEDNKE